MNVEGGGPGRYDIQFLKETRAMNLVNGSMILHVDERVGEVYYTTGNTSIINVNVYDITMDESSLLFEVAGNVSGKHYYNEIDGTVRIGANDYDLKTGLLIRTIQVPSNVTMRRGGGQNPSYIFDGEYFYSFDSNKLTTPQNINGFECNFATFKFESDGTLLQESVVSRVISTVNDVDDEREELRSPDISLVGNLIVVSGHISRKHRDTLSSSQKARFDDERFIVLNPNLEVIYDYGIPDYLWTDRFVSTGIFERKMVINIRQGNYENRFNSIAPIFSYVIGDNGEVGVSSVFLPLEHDVNGATLVSSNTHLVSGTKLNKIFKIQEV